MDIGVAGRGQFRAVRLEPSSYSAGSSWPARRVFKGRGTPPPKSQENRDGCSTGPSQRNGKKPGVVLRARGPHPCSEELGRKNWRLSTGSDASLRVSTLPLLPAF